LKSFSLLLLLFLIFYSGCTDEIIEPEPEANFSFSIVNANVGSVYAVALSVGDQHFAWGGQDPVVKVSGKPPFVSHISSINAIDFSKDGRQLLSGSSDNNIKLWDVESATLIKTFSEHVTNTWDVMFTPDGKSAISAENDYIVYWRNAVDGPIGKLAFYGHTGLVSSVDMSNDMKTIISGSQDKTIKVWDAHTGDLLKTISDHNGGVNDVEFNPANNQFASCSADSTIKIWDAQTFELIKTLISNNGGLRSISYHSSGNYIASAGPGSLIYIWDLTTDEVFRTLEGHTALVRSVEFSPIGNNVISGGSDDKVIIWSNVFSNVGTD
jgi:WD40 repeat protein